jgi:hypothetical protein
LLCSFLARDTEPVFYCDDSLPCVKCHEANERQAS